MLTLVLMEYHPQFIKTYAKDVVNCLLDDCSEILIEEEYKGRLTESRLMKPYSTLSPSTLQEQLEEIISIIKNNNKCSDLRAALTLYLLIFKQVEYEFRPAQYTNSYYRSGIDTTNFLLKILDYLVGTLEINKGSFLSPVQDPNSNEFLKEFRKDLIFDHEFR